MIGFQNVRYYILHTDITYFQDSWLSVLLCFPKCMSRLVDSDLLVDPARCWQAYLEHMNDLLSNGQRSFHIHSQWKGEDEVWRNKNSAYFFYLLFSLCHFCYFSLRISALALSKTLATHDPQEAGETPTPCFHDYPEGLSKHRERKKSQVS